MNATLTRNKQGDSGTFGSLVLDDGSTYATGECPWRDNQSRISCVPAGTYECEIYQSPTKGEVYMLQNVPNRADCEVHIGNWCGDTSLGYKSNVEGCIILGVSQGVLAGQDAVLSSGQAFLSFMGRQAAQPFTLTIVDAES